MSNSFIPYVSQPHGHKIRSEQKRAKSSTARIERLEKRAAANIKKISADANVEESKSSPRANEFKASVKAAKTARPRTPMARNVKRDAKPAESSKRVKESAETRPAPRKATVADPPKQPAQTTTEQKPVTAESDTQDANADFHVDVESNTADQVAAINHEFAEMFKSVAAPITYDMTNFPSLPAEQAVLDQTFAPTEGMPKPAEGPTVVPKAKPSKKKKTPKANPSQIAELRALIKKTAQSSNTSEQADLGTTQPMKPDAPATPTPTPTPKAS